MPPYVLHFMCRDPADVTGPEAAKLIARILELEGSGEESPFKDFRAVVEGDPGKPFPKHRYVLEGEAGWACLRDVNEVLRQKLVDEAEHNKTPGHVSYEPMMHLTRQTCGIIIGSRPFLFETARLCLAEKGVLRAKLLDLGQVICGLKSADEEPRADDHVQVNLWEEQFYPGYFDALAERVFRERLSEAKMLERIGRASGASDC